MFFFNDNTIFSPFNVCQDKTNLSKIKISLKERFLILGLEIPIIVVFQF